jgi:alpha-1,3-rhamnosyl/mannosyltransferase
MTRRPRVGVNLLWLVPGVVGGSEGYAVNLLSKLVERDDVEVSAFALPSFASTYPDLAAAAHTVVAPLPGGRHVVRRVMVENAWLPRQISEQRLDVAHHLGGLLPRCPVPAVVTLHDLQYLAYPEYFSAAKRRYLRLSQGSSLRRAAFVAAISEFTRDDAIRAFDLDPAKVVVVPPVVTPMRVPDDAARVRAELGLTRDFVLYPAAAYPHKNHETLLRAFAQVVDDGRDVDLVLTGATGAGAWGSAHSTVPRITALAAQLGVGDRVRTLGYVPAAQLAALYAEAVALAFPSRFEGFGLPVAEAMSVGCPVIAADATALPALVAGGGVLVDPDDVDGWAREIARVTDDPVVREKLSQAGRARFAELAAADSVERLVDVYRKAVA